MEEVVGKMSGGDGDQVRAGTAKMKMKVMVAIDESDGSFYALKWALNYLIEPMAAVGAPTPDPSLHQGMVVLLYVQPKLPHFAFSPVGPAGTALYTTPQVMDSVKRAQEQISATVLSRALQMCKDNLVKAESIIMNGDPREMICQAAEEMHVDLLVMGSRGLGTFRRAILGSVSDYCAHHAKTPILIVKPPMQHHQNKH